MPVSGRLPVYGTAQVEPVDDRSRTQIERLCNDLRDLIFRNLCRTERFDRNVHRARDADGICDLHFATIRQPGGDDILCNVACRVCAGAIDLRRIFSGKRAAAVPRHPAVRVGDNLASGQPGVAFRTADDETPGRVHINARVLVAQRCWNYVVDHFLGDLAANRFEGDVRIVLRRNDDRVDPHRLVAIVLYCDLRFAVRAKIRNVAVLAQRGKVTHQIMRQHDRQRHQFLGIAARVPKHHALIAGTQPLVAVVGVFAGLSLERIVDAQRDVGRLLVDRDADAAGFRIESDGRFGIPDVFDHLAHDTRNIDVCARRDLSGDVYLTRYRERFAGYAPLRVRFQNRIEHRIRDLIRDLIGMALGYGLAGKKTPVCHLRCPRSKKLCTSPVSA